MIKHKGSLAANMHNIKSKLIPLFILVFFLGSVSAFLLVPQDVVRAEIASEAEAKKRAEAYCKRYNGDRQEGFCLKSYQLAIKGLHNDLNSDSVCGKLSSGGDAYEGCRAGFLQGLREFKKDNPIKTTSPQADARAKAYCESKNYNKNPPPPDVSEYLACTTGYASSLSTDAVDWEVSCKNLVDDLKEVCIAGFKQGLREYQKDAGVSNPATPSNNNQAGAKSRNNEDVDCSTSLNSVLSWIACPIIDMGASFTDFVFKDFVRPMLENVPISADPDDAGYKAWQGFRLLGNLLLVGTLLAIVFGQMRGGGGR